MKSIYFVAGLLVMLVQGSWQHSLQDTEEKSRNGIAKHHDEFKRHPEGTFTNDFTSYLDYKATQDFIAWLKKGLGRQESLQATPVHVHRRHAEGSFSDEMSTYLDILTTLDFINWLHENKITDRQ